MNSVSLTILFGFNKVFVFVIVSFMSSINVMFLADKYHEYGGKVLDHHFVKTDQSTVFKYGMIALILITLTTQMFGAYQSSQTFNSSEFLDHKIFITSHRGNSIIAPENTVAAIRAAKNEKADVAEIDVQLTKDNEVVVIHDFDLSRLANDSRNVVDLTLKEIKELEVGSWFDESFRGEKIPTLEEVIDEAKGAIKLNIELKPSGDEKELALRVLEIVYEKRMEHQVIISSLNKEALAHVSDETDEIDVGYIIPVAIGKFEPEENIDFYSLEMSFVTKPLVEKLKNQEKELHVWTVNSEEDIKKMQALQVDSIITDDPMLAKQILSTNIIEKGIFEILNFFDL